MATTTTDTSLNQPGLDPSSITPMQGMQVNNATVPVSPSQYNPTSPATSLPGTDTSSQASQTYSGLIGATAQPTNTVQTADQASTVSGQLNTMLSSDSPLMEQAKSQGLSTANDRGMINSSVAAGASEAAMISAATPVAAQDASTNAALQLSANNANQTLNQTKYAGQVQTAQAAQNLFNSATLQAQQGGITEETQAKQQQATYALQTTLTQMGVNVSLDQINAQTQAAFVNAASPVMTAYQNTMTSIQMQPDSVMNAAAKQTALEGLKNTYIPQLQSLSNVYGFNVDWGTTTHTPATTTTPTNAYPTTPAVSTQTPATTATPAVSTQAPFFRWGGGNTVTLGDNAVMPVGASG